MKVHRNIIRIDEEKCDGCGQCVSGCAEGALAIIDGKARVVADRLCDGLGACIGECPQGALTIIQREADEFDESAVEAHLSRREAAPPLMACGCPSSQIQTFAPYDPDRDGSGSSLPAGEIPSALTHWPVQIRLIPPTAPFLKQADLLVLADCCAVALPTLHPTLLAGKVVMMGCPKFDDVDLYVQRFAEIFQTAGIRSITAAYMEVPCCSALPRILKKAMETSGIVLPIGEVVITRKGRIADA